MPEMDLTTALTDVARRRGIRGFTFDDLARTARHRRATIGQVADWLARARSAGDLQDMGFDAGMRGLGDGPRRYRFGTAPAASDGTETPERGTALKVPVAGADN
jgi:hypothetical protein